MAHIPDYIKAPVFGKDFSAPEPVCHVVNEPYSHMTDEQIANTVKDARPFFRPLVKGDMASVACRSGVNSDPLCNRVSRHTRQIPVDELRNLENEQSLGHIDRQFQRHAEEEHNTCRGRASVRWGPNKQGERTRSHYCGEIPARYNTIECYRRPATGISGHVTMDCGRPSEDYFSMRMAGKTAWTGSNVPLNRSGLVADLTRKTACQYEKKAKFEMDRRLAQVDMWPSISDHTRSYTLKAKLFQ